MIKSKKFLQENTQLWTEDSKSGGRFGNWFVAKDAKKAIEACKKACSEVEDCLGLTFIFDDGSYITLNEDSFSGHTDEREALSEDGDEHG